MAAPGVGIGDLVAVCVFIYDMCVKYKDAPKEFDEIADKAKSTAVVLERIRTEAKLRGNLVERAGPQGYSQLEHHLKGLKSDSDKLKALVAKYARIHDEGPGRRMLFTVMESSGLTDLRRRIGLHEQMLEMWYMTLIYGSLRRLEGGQEDILRAIEAMKKWSPTKRQHVRRSVREGDSKPLEQELCKSGLDPIAIKSALGAAVEYVDSPPREQVKMESRAKSSTVRKPEEGSFGEERPYDFSRGFGDSFGDRFEFDEGYDFGDTLTPPKDFPDIRRRKSTGSRKPRHFSSLSIHDGSSDDDDKPYKKKIVIETKDKDAPQRKEGDRLRPRSSSHNDPPILLAVPPPHRHHHRSKSQQTPKPEPYENLVHILSTPQPQRHRSHSRSSHSRSPHPPASSTSDPDRSQHERMRRDSSTHSYVREREGDPAGSRTRRRRSTSRGRDGHGGEDETVDRRRLVTRMDRIDSIPIDQS